MWNPSDVAALKARIGDRVVVASVSGGKDSTAMCLFLQELGIEHRRVHCLTGWDHPATMEYLEGPLQQAIGPIEFLRPQRLMADLCRHKGMFPSRPRRFCTQELKVKPIAAYLNAIEEAEPLNVVGIRAEESEERSKYPEWERFDAADCEVWRPILGWSEQQVIDIHHRHGVRPNPLYLQGMSRVGCWPCIFARKAELKALPAERVAEIRALEAEVQEAARKRHEARGETFESTGHNPPTFFQAMGALRTEGKDVRCVPIDEVMRWARTAQGGKQFELFDSTDRDAGCMRWGLCEVRGEG